MRRPRQQQKKPRVPEQKTPRGLRDGAGCLVQHCPQQVFLALGTLRIPTPQPHCDHHILLDTETLQGVRVPSGIKIRNVSGGYKDCTLPRRDSRSHCAIEIDPRHKLIIKNPQLPEQPRNQFSC